MKHGRVLPLLALLLAAGCGGGMPEGFVRCEPPRPQMCTRQYDPVCALDETGRWRTRGNACDACALREVRGWRPGPCPP